MKLMLLCQFGYNIDQNGNKALKSLPDLCIEH
jgi:hypothetical protein